MRRLNKVILLSAIDSVIADYRGHQRPDQAQRAKIAEALGVVRDFVGWKYFDPKPTDIAETQISEIRRLRRR